MTWLTPLLVSQEALLRLPAYISETYTHYFPLALALPLSVLLRAEVEQGRWIQRHKKLRKKRAAYESLFRIRVPRHGCEREKERESRTNTMYAPIRTDRIAGARKAFVLEHYCIWRIRVPKHQHNSTREDEKNEKTKNSKRVEKKENQRAANEKKKRGRERE